MNILTAKLYKNETLSYYIREAKMSELLIVRSKLKDYIKLNISGDFGEALSKEVERLIKKAVERAEANGRRTVQARDV